MRNIYKNRIDIHNFFVIVVTNVALPTKSGHLGFVHCWQRGKAYIWWSTTDGKVWFNINFVHKWKMSVCACVCMWGGGESPCILIYLPTSQSGEHLYQWFYVSVCDTHFSNSSYTFTRASDLLTMPDVANEYFGFVLLVFRFVLLVFRFSGGSYCFTYGVYIKFAN